MLVYCRKNVMDLLRNNRAIIEDCAYLFAYMTKVRNAHIALPILSYDKYMFIGT